MGGANQKESARRGIGIPGGSFFYFSFYYFTAVCPMAGEV